VGDGARRDVRVIPHGFGPRLDLSFAKKNHVCISYKAVSRVVKAHGPVGRG
jgi:hypothetical protein